MIANSRILIKLTFQNQLNEKSNYHFWLIFFLLFASIAILKSWVVNKFEASLNQNPDRKYDLSYDDLSLSIIQGNIELTKVKISPLRDDSISTSINGSVEKATLEGVRTLSYIFSKELSIKNLSFINPEFILVHKNNPRTHRNNSKPFQVLFQDIISRGEIKNFSLSGGKAILYDQDTTQKVGGFNDLEILATGLETDSVQVGRAIPFLLENLQISFQELDFNLSENETLYLGSYDFDFGKEQMTFSDLSLKLNSDWKEIANSQPTQKEILEFDIGQLKLDGLSTESRFYDSLVIISQKVIIDSLDFYISKNKNRPEAEKVIKKDFSYLLEALAFPVGIDSLLIQNSKITYSEIGEGKSQAGKITLSDVNGLILNLTSIDQIQKQKSIDISISCLFDNSGKLELKVSENYFERRWKADLVLSDMDMRELNQTVNHLAGIEIESGELQKLHLYMEADSTSSNNHFLMQYNNLKMNLLDADDHKKGFLSTVANLAIHKQHQPGDKHFQELTYSTTRDQYKGPINLIWLSAKDGLLATIPTNLAHKLMPQSKESKKVQRLKRKAERKAANNN